MQEVLVCKKRTYEISERRPVPPAFHLIEKETPTQVLIHSILQNF